MKLINIKRNVKGAIYVSSEKEGQLSIISSIDHVLDNTHPQFQTEYQLSKRNTK